ncbi:MAG: GNAT family protein [Oscillospiraceae bacterium]|nr:GNAT family protein [Oscillospiraceae bacterium]
MYAQTERLILRPCTAGDFEDYFAYIMEPELQYMLGLDGVTDRASAKEEFQWLLENRTLLAIVQKSSSRMIGHICLHPPYESVAQDPEYEGKKGVSLSYALKKSERRQGLMVEALRKTIQMIFQEEKADYIDCEYPSFNGASKAVQEKLDFRYWGSERFGDIELFINVLINHESYEGEEL